jgi:hypothetical protein
MLEPGKKSREARHRANGIDSRIDCDPEYVRIAIVDRILEKRQTLLEVAERDLQIREVLRGNALLAFLRVAPEFLKRALCVCLVARQGLEPNRLKAPRKEAPTRQL